MLITQDTDEGFYKIKSYTAGSITVNEESFSTPFLVSAENLISPWKIDLNNLSLTDFDFLDELKPAVFLFGTGEKLLFPPAEILKKFHDARIGFECMTTAAACRTFNVLVSERRDVLAGLIP